jgi:hypothetical protein
MILCLGSILFHGNHHERLCGSPPMMKVVPRKTFG